MCLLPHMSLSQFNLGTVLVPGFTRHWDHVLWELSCPLDFLPVLVLLAP